MFRLWERVHDYDSKRVEKKKQLSKLTVCPLH